MLCKEDYKKLIKSVNKNINFKMMLILTGETMEIAPHLLKMIKTAELVGLHQSLL